MKDEVVHGAGDGALYIPKQLWKRLLICFIYVGSALGRNDTLSSKIGRSSILAISVDNMIESERLTLRRIDVWDVRLLRRSVLLAVQLPLLTMSMARL